MLKFINNKLLNIDPLIKLTPIIKLIGNSIVSLMSKLTFDLFVLFCIPIIKIKKKHELNNVFNNILLKSVKIGINIILILIQIINNAFFKVFLFS